MVDLTKSRSFSFSESDMPIRFGRYLLMKTKNTDAVGEEFLAAWGVDEGVDQLRIVRGIYPAVAEDAKFVRLFSEEARSLSRLASGNVVRVMEVATLGGIPFVACEHVEGITLSRLFELSKHSNESCPWELAAHIAAEMLRGLDYVHCREDILGAPMGMKHGDVRPSNVVISFDGEVKLTNFGSALDYIADEKTNARVQTYRGIYAPPEHSSKEGATQAGDLWGVAACMSVLLGREDASLSGDGAVYRHNEGLAAALDGFLDKSLCEDTNERFEDAVSMREALLQIMADHASGHPADGLAKWARKLGAKDREEEQILVRTMLGQDSQLELVQAAKDKKMGEGVVLDGRYHLLKQLGEGGMGLVFAAEHLGIGRKVALKILHERVLDDQTAVARFRREAQIMGSLKHPNIVHVSDFGVTSEGYHYLVMDLLEGESLADRIAKGAIEPTETIRIMASVCDGLEVAHQAGVVHRDLKPENVFLVGDEPKILDFGIAKRTGLDMDQSLTNTGFMCGTAEYMAPEIIGGQEAGERGDVYAVGVMIYEALTQKTPFRGRTVGETLHKAMIDRVVPPRKRTDDRSIPKELEVACLKALERNPNKRFLSAAETGKALRAVVDPALRRKSVSAMSPSKGWNAKLWASLTVAVAVVSFLVYALVRWATSDLPEGAKQSVVDLSPASSDQLAKKPTAQDPKPSVVMLEESSKQVSPASNSASEPSSVGESIPTPELAPLSNPKPSLPKRDTAIGGSKENAVADSVVRNEDVERLEEIIKAGQAELRKLNLKKAKRLFEQALELNPGASKAHFGLGKTAFENSDYKEAVKRINRALTIAPRKHKWRIYLGKVHMALGERDKAIEDWKTVLEHDPKNDEALALLADVGAS